MPHNCDAPAFEPTPADDYSVATAGVPGRDIGAPATGRGWDVAGSGRARRFKKARELKQGGPERICSICHSNLSMGEEHDPDCDFATREDPYAIDDDDEETSDEEAW